MDIDISAEREAIDAIDEQIANLLSERCQLVRRVGGIKRRALPEGMSFIRPAREADMVRHVLRRFRGNGFPPLAAAQMWRLIISASLSIESPFAVSCFATDARQEVYWHAREYFCNFTPMLRQPTARRALADVMEGKAGVGALPMPDASTEGQWWLKLPPDIHIFACAPFVLTPGLGQNTQPHCLLVARVMPEPTEDDISLYSIETLQDVSQSRIKTICDQQQLSVRWLAAESFPSGHRVHLIELRGFHTPDMPAIQAFHRDIGASLRALRWLGSYASPVTYEGNER